MTAKNKATKRIRILIWEKDLNVAALARRIGKSRTWTSQVLYGRMRSEATRRAIADTLGVSVVELWPENNRKAA